MIGLISQRIASAIARYDMYARSDSSMTRYSRAEVEAAYAALQAAEAELDAALESAEAVLAPMRVNMGLWSEIQDARYHKLETLTLADLPIAEALNFRHTAEAFPLSQWTTAAAAWRGLARRITREIARIARTRAA